MKRCRVPRKKMLIGHTKQYDIYQTPRGIIYWYFGTEKADWKNCKMWKRVRGDQFLTKEDKRKLGVFRKMFTHPLKYQM